MNKNILNIKSLLVLAFVMLLFIPCRIYKANNFGKNQKQKILFFKPVIDSLIAKGADSAFVINFISDPKTKFNEKYVKINVTGYLKKADYSSNYNYRSIKKCRSFYKQNKKLLKSAEKLYGVSAKIITSILWIETKFGRYTGKHHLGNVFFSTALANRYEFIQLNLNNLKKQNIKDRLKYDSLKKKVYERSAKKSDWAIQQILYLDTARAKLPVDVSSLYGSWAGAFGLCQFLPSSYVRWAVDGNGDTKIDLFNLDDAVFSIANYLISNGWSNNYQDKRNALFHYNNSQDYVHAVLTLASKI